MYVLFFQDIQKIDIFEIAPIRACIACLYDYLVLSRYNTTVFDNQ